MTSLTEQFTRGVARLERIIGGIVLRMALVLAAAVVVVGMGSALDLPDYTPAAGAATPAAATPAEDCAPESGQLFNPCATLDTSSIDDLRSTDDALCLAAGGVLTPAGVCVDAVAVWEHEVDAGTWEALLALGYTWSLTHGSEQDGPALWIPAEFVILGGEDGDTVLAVDVTRPVTPRS